MSAFILISIVSCVQNDPEHIEKRIAVEIAEYIIAKDSLNARVYLDDILLHVSSKKLNENTFKTYVSLNSLTSESDNLILSKTTVHGLKTIVYYQENDDEFDLAEPFFVLHAEGWVFLSEYDNDEIKLSELTRVFLQDDNQTVDLLEIDM